MRSPTRSAPPASGGAAPRARRPGLALTLLLVAVVSAACQPAEPPTPTRAVVRTAVAAPTATLSAPAATATPALAAPTATSVPPPTPTLTPAAREANIVVTAPTRDQAIQSPVRIAGRARVFEAAVVVEVVAGGALLGRGYTTASAGAPEWGDLAFVFPFAPPEKATAGLVRVYSTSPKDGSVLDLVEVPVQVQPGGAPPAGPTPVKPTAEPNVVVSSPVSGASVSTPVQIAGRARVFEAAVVAEVVADGKLLGRAYATAGAGAPEWGDLALGLDFAPPAKPTAGLVRVYSRSARDGSVINLVEVPVQLQPGGSPVALATAVPGAGTRQVTVFYPREGDDDVVFVPVTRSIATTPAIGQATLQELLEGPTPDERARGLYTPIPAGTRLLGLRIGDGVAYADFDKQMEYQMGGAVRVMSVRRMIELTLKQFSTVQRVVVSVEGKTQAVLQP